MKHRLAASLGLALLVLLGISSGAQAADKVKAVASFSILGDMVRQVGGDRVEVVTLVGPDGDAHVFSPTPADAKALASSQLFFVNGLGFEGWMERLEKSSGFKGKTIVASHGVKPHTMVKARTMTSMTMRSRRARAEEETKELPTRMPGRTSPTASSMSPIFATG